MFQFQSPTLVVPGGSIIGVIQEGTSKLTADGVTSLGPRDALPAEGGNFVLEYPFSQSSALEKARGISRLLELRRAGAALAVISHDEGLLESCADEIWWLRDGSLRARGDPAEVLAAYHQYVAAALRSSGSDRATPLTPTLRDGDGRAALESIELLGENGEPTGVWRSGEEAAIRVTVLYSASLADPVIGIMIRTRIGLNVYGTNTELEHIHFGPVESGDQVRVVYRFACNLCPGDYTITAAAHDPDGTWHDWQDDAVAFAVSDSRYTAGVANLRARLTAEVSHASESQKRVTR
jgi:lipopolysaccharide transport system ATP-binding protein